MTGKTEQATYTCPMHPEVQQKGAGDCPKCGMSLEPLTIILEDSNENGELKDIERRFWLAAFLTVPVFVLSMGPMVGLNIRPWLGELMSAAIEFTLATVVVIWCGWPLLQKGWRSFRNMNLNMFSLITIGVVAAYASSVIVFLFPDVLPAEYLGSHGKTPLYFESAAVIVTLVLLGQVLELRARNKTGSAIKSLLKLSPKTANKILENGTELKVPIEEVELNDRVLVRPGEQIPIDAVVIEGMASVDESTLTGEPMPVKKVLGQNVFAATICLDGTLTLQAISIGTESKFAQIIEMVNSAQRSRSPIQKTVDRVSVYFVSAVFVISALAFAAWLVFGPSPSIIYATIAAISVLIIACPCALGLATPISIVSAMGRGAREGVLIKDAEALEELSKIDTLILDKTGTLTEGTPSFSSIKLFGNQDPEKLIQVAASLEVKSEHPVAKAIVTNARERQIPLVKASDFQAFSGKGISGEVEGEQVLIGSPKFIQSYGVDLPQSTLAAEGEVEQISVFMAIDHDLVAIISVTDQVRDNALSSLEALRMRGIDLVLATGDQQATAEFVANELGIEKVYSEILPDEKADLVKSFQQMGKKVAMIGDGINDAPALATADVGIAMGTGTDVAIENGSIVIVGGELTGLVRGFDLSKETMVNIRQNLFFALAYNGLGIPVAAGILFPFVGVLLSPMIAAVAMSFSSVSVIANALRLSRSRG